MSKRRRGGEPGRGNPHQQDRWVPPTKADRLKKKADAKAETSNLTLEQQLNVALMSNYLPMVDMHSMRREDVALEVDALIANNPGKAIRVMYGKGTGALQKETMQYLHNLKRQKKILGYREDTNGSSVVIITPER